MRPRFSIWRPNELLPVYQPAINYHQHIYLCSPTRTQTVRGDHKWRSWAEGWNQFHVIFLNMHWEKDTVSNKINKGSG